MDHPAGRGTLFCKGAHFGHQIVVDFSLDFQGAADIYIVFSGCNSFTWSSLTRPNSDWAWAKATQILRHSRRFCTSLHSWRISGLAYRQVNGERYAS